MHFTEKPTAKQRCLKILKQYHLRIITVNYEAEKQNKNEYNNVRITSDSLASNKEKKIA